MYRFVRRSSVCWSCPMPSLRWMRRRASCCSSSMTTTLHEPSSTQRFTPSQPPGQWSTQPGVTMSSLIVTQLATTCCDRMLMITYECFRMIYIRLLPEKFEIFSDIWISKHSNVFIAGLQKMIHHPRVLQVSNTTYLLYMYLSCSLTHKYNTIELSHNANAVQFVWPCHCHYCTSIARHTVAYIRKTVV